ncbi:MAG: hypothetical protein MMC33_008326 [Icmadophila ericetorum]|nr:hypothetical protein [Icmadophila ericetorum]
MPVCEACIVKKSFNKKENKFNSRRRYVCKDCWQVDRPQATQSQFQAYESALLDHDSNEICHCTPKNAVLCLSCKDGQNRDLHKQIDHCAGFGCSIALTAENIGGSYCLWCNLMLTKASTSQQSRRLFNSRYEPQLVAYAQVIGMKRSLAGYEPMEYFKKQRNLEDKFRTEILEGLGANLSHPMLTGTATPFDEDCIIINRRDNEATEEHVKAERAMYKTEVEAAHQSSSCRLELEGLEDEDYVLVETDSQPESPRTVVGDTKTSAKEDWESVAFGDDISSSQTLPK